MSDVNSSNPDKGQEPVDPKILQALSGLPEDFSHFPNVFQNEIRPALLAREDERIAAAARARQSRYIGIGIALMGILASLFLLRMPIVAFVAAIIGVAYWLWGVRDIRRLAGEAKALIVQPVAREFDLDFVAEPGTVESIYQYHDVGIVPGWDRAKYEDLVTGSRKGIEFELFEAHLEERRRSTDSKGRTQTRWVTVFRGQCLRFHFPKQFYGRTLVTRDAGFFNRFGGGKGMQRAMLEDPKFEKIFEVYTTDQVESRYLLTPDLMQKLVDMEDTFHGGRLKCCFSGGEMYITLEGGNLFEPGSMFRPLDSANRIRELLNDFAAVFHIIDSVHSGRQRAARERGD